MGKGRGRYGGIHSAILDDSDYLQLTPRARLVLLTMKIDLGPGGIDVVEPATFAEKVGETVADVLEAWRELAESRNRWILFDRLPHSSRYLVWIRNGLKFEPSLQMTNEMHKKGLLKYLAGLPRLRIVNEFADYYKLEPPFEASSLIDEIDPIDTPADASRMGIEGDSHPVPIPVPIPERSKSSANDRAGGHHQLRPGNAFAEAVPLLQENLWLDQEPPSGDRSRELSVFKQLAAEFSAEEILGIIPLARSAFRLEDRPASLRLLNAKENRPAVRELIHEFQRRRATDNGRGETNLGQLAREVAT